MKATKRIFIATLLLGAATGMSITASAQDHCAPQSEESRTQLATSQASEIASELNLNDELKQKFTDIYVKCQKEMWASFPDKKLGKAHDKSKELTDQQAEEIIKARFAHKRKMDEIQERYYKQYRKILTPVQILKVYDLERKQMRKMVKKDMHKLGKDKMCKLKKGEMRKLDKMDKKKHHKGKK